jgi:3D (Asp-Asp-Asp) domain-containing protein
MTPLPRPRFSHAARAIRARIWQRCRPHLAFLLVIALTTLVLVIGTAHAQELRPGRAAWAEVTAYCPCDICCAGTSDGITADGTRTDRVPYGLAADPLLVPYGTLVYLPLGHGALDRVRMDNRLFRVDDTGGSVVTEGREKGILRLDLRVKEHWWAKRFGRKLMLVFITN